MVYKSHGIYDMRFILKGFKDEGLYKPHVGSHQYYVLDLFMLGDSVYRVWNLGVIGVKVIKVITI
jgi:hypothetical protein